MNSTNNDAERFVCNILKSLLKFNLQTMFQGFSSKKSIILERYTIPVTTCKYLS